jgi:uroporphyrinogen-III synthase
MRLLVTRPEPDASRLAAALATRGHEPVLAPLLAVKFLTDVDLPLAGAQAVIVTSGNALRALASHPDLRQATTLPLFAVGEATAAKAEDLGFAHVTVGPGTGEDLAQIIAGTLSPAQGPLLHLAGESLAFDLKTALEAEGFEVRKSVLYRTEPARALAPEALGMLLEGKLDGAILMSPRTAKTFAELVARHGAVTQAKGLVCYCLSPAVAEALAPLGVQVRVATHPREEDLLALLGTAAPSS